MNSSCKTKKKYYLLIFAGFILMFLLLHGNRGEDYNAMLSIDNTRNTGIPSIASSGLEQENIRWNDANYMAVPLLESDDRQIQFMESGGGDHFKIEFDFNKNSSLNKNVNMRGEWKDAESGLVYLYYQEWQGNRYKSTLDYNGLLMRTKILVVDMETKSLAEAREAGRNEVVLTIVDDKVYIYESGTIYTRDWDNWEIINELLEVDYTGANHIWLRFTVAEDGIQFNYGSRADLWIPYS